MTQSKHIALITHEFYPVLSGGGVTAHKLALEFQRRGHRVTILTSGVGSSFNSQENLDGILVRRFNTRRHSKHDAKFSEITLFVLLGLPQMLWYCLRHKFDLFFCLFIIPSGFLGMVLMHLLRKPSFAFVDTADIPGGQSAQQKVVRFLAPVFHIVTRFSAGIIVLQGHEDIALQHVKTSRYILIPNGTTIPEDTATPGTKQRSLEFLSIGRLVLRKGFQEILEAFAIVKQKRLDFKLKIIGYGTKEEIIRGVLAKLKLEDNVELLGRVEYGHLKDFYLNSDYYIFYGAPEGSSLAMIEALAYGLPILASDDIGTRIYVKDGYNGYLVAYPKPQDLALKILKILAERDKIPDFGRHSRELALEYSWEKIADRYLRFFEKC